MRGIAGAELRAFLARCLSWRFSQRPVLARHDFFLLRRKDGDEFALLLLRYLELLERLAKIPDERVKVAATPMRPVSAG